MAAVSKVRAEVPKELVQAEESLKSAQNRVDQLRENMDYLPIAQSNEMANIHYLGDRQYQLIRRADHERAYGALEREIQSAEFDLLAEQANVAALKAKFASAQT